MMNKQYFDLTITHGEAIRFALLMTHYSRPAEIGPDKVAQAQKALRRLALACVPNNNPPPSAFIDILCQDMNTPGAIAKMHEYRANKMGAELWASLRFLGFFGNVFFGLDELKTFPHGHEFNNAEYHGPIVGGVAS